MPTNFKAFPRRRGFTLIEVLVVMTIIVILMAALLPVVGMVMSNAKKQQTNTLIKTLAAGLEMYRSELGIFPPTPGGAGGDPEDDGTLFTALMGKDGKGLVVNPGQPNEKHFAPFVNIPSEFCKRVDDKVIVVDSFGKPLHYFNCKAYVESGKPAENCHNEGSFDIWSYGPDKQKDPAMVVPGTGKVEDPTKVKYVDDIKNW